MKPSRSSKEGNHMYARGSQTSLKITGVVFGILLVALPAWSAEPLKIRDVENMSTPDIVGTPGNPANGNPFLQINSIRGTDVFPFNQHLASLTFLPEPLFDDAGTPLPEPIQVVLIALSEEGEIILNIKAGDRVNVTFDGGQQVTLFLPALTVKPVTDFNLFPATDGSTYFDVALTQLAQAAPKKAKTVLLDIKPGSDPNSINLKSQGNTPAAILSGGPDNVDASQVEASTVKLAGASSLHSSLEDVNGDGRQDLVLHFDTQALQFTSGSTSATLAGKLKDGTDIQGSHSVRIIGE